MNGARIVASTPSPADATAPHRRTPLRYGSTPCGVKAARGRASRAPRPLQGLLQNRGARLDRTAQTRPTRRGLRPAPTC